MPEPVKLLVGLGNPGSGYAGTRHNAGEDFVRRVAAAHGGAMRNVPRFFGETSRITLGGIDLRLLIPDTFMNLSGQSVAAIASFYRFVPTAILIAHDELDIEAGQCRFKADGGHGGHNGLRDIIEKLGKSDFYRLRIGIGHPGSAREVHDYVLGRAPASERERTKLATDEALQILPEAISGNWQIAMNHLHNFSA